MKRWLITIAISVAMATATQAMATDKGNPFVGKTKASGCIDCHGEDGNSSEPSFPKLAGQGEAYLLKQLIDFKSGERKSDFMGSIMADLNEQDMADMAAYYAVNARRPGAVSESLLEAGQKLYRAGNKKTGVPACMACHGPNGNGIPVAKWPALSGQHIRYIEGQLRAFADGSRANDPNSMMRDIAARMTESELKAVSAYVSGLY